MEAGLISHFNLTFVRTLLEIYVFRVIRFWPAMIFVFFVIQAFLFFLDNGPNWYEVGAHFEGCKEYWWTPFLFVNDLVPYQTRELRGCMRYTAIFSIEMKYYLIMPLVIYFYHIGYKLTSVLLCSTLILAGFSMNWICLIMNEISPGYTNYVDVEFLDLYLLKPWSHIASYFTGVLLCLFYQEFKLYKFGDDKKSF